MSFSFNEMLNQPMLNFERLTFEEAQELINGPSVPNGRFDAHIEEYNEAQSFLVDIYDDNNKGTDNINSSEEYRPWDGPYDGDPSDLDYTTIDYCDICDRKDRQVGTMHHARGATGRVCPVMFIGDCCK